MRPKFPHLSTMYAIGLFLLCTTVWAQPNFINKIPIPPLLDASADTVVLEMKLQAHQFNPGNPGDTLLNGTSKQNGIQAWSYNVKGSNAMTYLGPTLKWKTGKMTYINIVNKLPEATTTHWHGAEIPAYLDGGPHQHIEVGQTWPVYFKNLDKPATLWYHPHFHNNTFPQVLLGLSGMIISEQEDDPIAATLPRTYGIDDLPIILGDQGLSYDTVNKIQVIDTLKAKRPINLVNGLSNPYVELPAHLVRLRILNGSSRKGIKLALAKDIGTQVFEPITQIATDGGYTLKPDTIRSLLTGPGERYEIILDLRSYKVGDTLYLRNLKKEMPGYIVGSPNPTTGPGGGGDTTSGNAFLQIRIIADPSAYKPVDTFVPFTHSWDAAVADTLNITKRRTKNLVLVKVGKKDSFMIDHKTYELHTINDTICLGAKEVWTINNQSGVAHPFHIHKIFFRILDIDSMGTKINLASRGLNGPKDDVLVFPNWKLRFMAKFDDYPNAIDPHLTYMYHCHILTHEDVQGGGMMHQFVVTNDQQVCPGTVGTGHAGHDMTMTLYPNPATEELYLMGHSSEITKVRLIDIQGRVLKTQVLPAINGRTNINIQGLKTGLYFIAWDTPKGRLVQKVVIKP